MKELSPSEEELKVVCWTSLALNLSLVELRLRGKSFNLHQWIGGGTKIAFLVETQGCAFYETSESFARSM
jgi:hypothetical protein